jgi:DNA-binding NarL/FixJ family response regulator
MKPRTVQAHALLLASKDQAVQRQVRRCLLTGGLSPRGLTIARNEPQWQEALNRQRPRLVMLDDGIAPGNGVVLLDALRRRFPDVLTVYLAEQHTAELERAVRQLGVLYYTEKPAEESVLERVLITVFSVHSPTPPHLLSSSSTAP